MPPLRVCIIGAGASGLPAIKSCIESGLEVVCYERTSELGGLWNYRPQQKVGGTVMASTVVNTSKEMMAYSDYPPPETLPNFMHHSSVLQYMKNYGEAFDLLKHIQFNTEVKKVKKSADNQHWEVNLHSGKTEIFDKVILATGHHAEPGWPSFRGLDKFKGRISHAHSYRDFKGYEGKDVVLVGFGNSALDIAVELAKIAKSVTISTRRGTWIFNRCAQGGMPYDITFHTRLYYWLLNTLPTSIVSDFMEHRLQQRLDHDVYGIRPSHRFFEQHPTVNDALANLLCCGQIVITEDVETFEEKSIIVKGGRSFPCDELILCTGYTFGFPFLEPQNLIPVKDLVVDLYKFVFPPTDPSLAVIGLIQPIGSVAPISEMQSRWVAAVFTGVVTLPDSISMYKDIRSKQSAMEKRYFSSTKHTIQVDYVPYMDELASIIGCLPPVKESFFSDFRLFLRLFVGANVPYVYRLTGPGSWSGARDAIFDVPRRVKLPLKNRQCRTRKHKKRGTLDEYFRYGALKALAIALTFLILTGLFAAFVTPPGTSVLTIMAYFLSFSFWLSFVLLWFDLQYDMSTIF